MTRRARLVLPAALAAATIASGAWLAASPGDTRDDAWTPPAPVCEWSAPEWRCMVATPGVPAVVAIHAYEDGSARVAAHDPDTGGRLDRK